MQNSEFWNLFFFKLICEDCCKISRETCIFCYTKLQLRMFFYHISLENVYIFSRAEVMSYLMTYSVFNSFWFLAQKIRFNTTATPQANLYHKWKFILPKTNFHLSCGKPYAVYQEFSINIPLFMFYSFCILYKVFSLLNADLVGVFFFF